MRPLLMTLGDYRSLSLNGAKRLSYLTQLFPSSFNEKLCEQLLQHLKKLLEVAILAHKGNTSCRPLVPLVEVLSSNQLAAAAVLAIVCLSLFRRSVHQTVKKRKNWMLQFWSQTYLQPVDARIKCRLYSEKSWQFKCLSLLCVLWVIYIYIYDFRHFSLTLLVSCN